MNNQPKKQKKHVYYDKTAEISIIKHYQDLIIYVYNLLIKYPNIEGQYLAKDTQQVLNEGLECLIIAKRKDHKHEKMNSLFTAKIKLETLIIYVRISYKVKYINKRNYGSWSHKISKIMDELDNWMAYCQS